MVVAEVIKNLTTRITYSLFFVCGVLLSLCSVEAAEVSLNVQWDTLQEYQISGQMLIKDAQLQGDELCLYLPLNDPDKEFHPLRNYNFLQGPSASHMRDSGDLKITRIMGGKLVKETTENTREKFIKIQVVPNENLLLHFVARLPRWRYSTTEEWHALHFHPLPMSSCESKDKNSLQSPAENRIRMQLQFDPRLMIASNGVEISSQNVSSTVRRKTFEFEGESLSFVVGASLQRKIIRQAHFYVEVFHKSEEFLELIEPLLDILNYHTELFGAYPFPKLTLVEAVDLESAGVPGMIVINQETPHEGLGVQQFFTNWTVWQLAYFASEQWYGGSLKYKNMRDFWFFKGVNDFAAYRALKRMKEGFDFFRSYDYRPSRLTFNYRQNQDLLAFILTFFQQHNHLVGRDFSSDRTHDDQHPLGYIRHSVALRQLEWSMGGEAFTQAMKEITQHFKGKRMEPKDFISFPYRVLDANQKHKLQDHVRQWWQSDSWPDFFIDNVVTKELSGDIYQVDVFVREKNGFDLPVNIEVIDEQGVSYIQTVKKTSENLWFSTFHIRAPLSSVYIDPEKEIFDWNRFNNSTRSPNFYFFPGSARTLYDADYTVLWLPMLGHLPGDELTLYLSAQALRYVHDGVTAVVNYATHSKRFGVSLMHEATLPRFGGYSLLSFEHDSPINRNERNIEYSLNRRSTSVDNPVIQFGFSVRHRQLLDQKETGHELLGISLDIAPLNRRNCNFNLNTKAEMVAIARSKELRYQRYRGKLEGNCQISPLLDISARLFRGQLDEKGSKIPSNAYFLPQHVNEARVRVPSPRLEGVKDILSTSLEVHLPAHLGFGGMVLNNQMRWRVFYDYASSQSDSQIIRASGLGLSLPVGGQVVGKGVVSLFQFSLLYVPYVHVSDRDDGRGGVLFDFLGHL